ncbi:sigma-54 dependent transcriptional regulator [Chitinispirillales bacterium ANBcel5]|uniref:sigma-54-dependent transcriptional regulator n=1 Tax=Cellulosispirillum alkaliphilum TaxID=3039283 RepID=UPI002A51553F|nr:sigma-54 dependent transcriptional regulator [Chitinispirillales bacterium ANBcel5]
MDNSKKSIIAVIDDDKAQRKLITSALADAGYCTLSGQSGEEALELASKCHLMLLDVRLPGMSGLEAMQKILQVHSSLPIIILTAYIDLRDAVCAIRAGARDYLEKPVDLDELIAGVDDILVVPDATKKQRDDLKLSSAIVAESEAMRRVFIQAMRAANCDAPVLLLGESGVGKDVVAEYIHRTSRRSNKPFVRVNCGALPSALIESELFGHEKGAFTGAASARQGRFEEAGEGTIFLDELGELDLSLQPKLLHVLENGFFRRVGGSGDFKTDARVITATNRSLEEAVQSGCFRQDLYYRVNVLTIVIPPLRERQDDILPLAEKLLYSKKLRLSPAAQRIFMNYNWPGNLRELRNALERASIMVNGPVILPEHLPPQLQRAPALQRNGSVLVGDMQTIQREAIAEALRQTGGNKTRAAQILNISRRNLLYKIREYGFK